MHSMARTSNNHMLDGLNKLDNDDIYSLALFTLYKLTDDPKYASVSELVYLLDKKSLFNLLDYYGGMTIKIPTRDELMNVINALILYYRLKTEDVDIKKVIDDLNIQPNNLKDVLSIYTIIESVMINYNFNREHKNN